MFKQNELLEIISGKRNGVLPTAIRFGLGCLTPVYRIVIGGRNRKFDRAAIQNDQALIKKSSIPVVSVGNITTGGTGKTPLVIWIAKHFRRQNKRVALISRGYGADQRRGANHSAGGRNDEALEMEHRLPDVPHLQDPDRFRMSQIAEEELESEILVLDDAFQHRKFHRDLDIVLIDATLPFGFGRLLPRGLLREPVESLHRADMVILTRTDLVAGNQKSETIARIRQHIGDRPIAETQTVPSEFLRFDGKTFPIEEIKGKKVLQLCAIGNPSNFELTLKNLGIEIVGSSVFPDHHQFSREELQSVGELANQCGAEAIICTHKDLVKIGTNQLNRVPVYALLIDVEFLAGQPELEVRLDRLIPS
ncbi:MAG: tetraacyldisaccharide 4'-kinase [Mariniblastus sp.]